MALQFGKHQQESPSTTAAAAYVNIRPLDQLFTADDIPTGCCLHQLFVDVSVQLGLIQLLQKRFQSHCETKTTQYCHKTSQESKVNQKERKRLTAYALD